ncbi:hypothetical protein EWM62_12945 [Mucilaginibacter terrigena]|uniref:Lipoprotein n=1 Tax=Mucilaginibacter terrigena TaxID=2492395 RepID=A0A4Q5LK98_9SPHI|nr:hypothetical protein [Mucilaginibacter terrigena]RYU89240.1 hypothetical protein EWM62_12945 [Mucilaginibacter terrigena]
MFKSAVLKVVMIVSFVAALSSCDYVIKKEKFTTKGWDEGDGITFPKRDGMIDDLLATHQLKGLTYKQALGLLKYPQRNGLVQKSMEYEIIRKMDGIDTIYAKSLVLYLNKDSVVSNYKVTEKDNKEKLKLKFEKQNAEKK